MKFVILIVSVLICVQVCNGAASVTQKPSVAKGNGAASVTQKPSVAKGNGAASVTQKPSVAKGNGAASVTQKPSVAKGNGAASVTQKPSVAKGNGAASVTQKPSVAKGNGAASVTQKPPATTAKPSPTSSTDPIIVECTKDLMKITVVDKNKFSIFVEKKTLGSCNITSGTNTNAVELTNCLSENITISVTTGTGRKVIVSKYNAMCIQDSFSGEILNVTGSWSKIDDNNSYLEKHMTPETITLTMTFSKKGNSKGPPVTDATLGEKLQMHIKSNATVTGLRLVPKSCKAYGQNKKDSVNLTGISNHTSCPTKAAKGLMESFTYEANHTELMATVTAFEFISDSLVEFSCEIIVCNETDTSGECAAKIDQSQTFCPKTTSRRRRDVHQSPSGLKVTKQVAASLRIHSDGSIESGTGRKAVSFLSLVVLLLGWIV